MKYIFIISFLFITGFSYTTDSKTGIYQLSEVLINKDFDTKWLDNIDNIEIPYPKNSGYQIGDIKLKKGKYTILKFIHTHWGEVSYSNSPVLIHELLWLKIDKSKKIIDAYHYTLEWQDSPSIKLYKMDSTAEVQLKSPLMIAQLKLHSSERGKLNINAILDPHYQSGKYF